MPGPVHTRCRQYHDGLRQLQVQWKVNTAGTTASNTAEWTYVGELVTPFLTPTLEVRVVQDLGTFVYPGVRRELVLNQSFSVVPHVNFGGGSGRWNRNRYGHLVESDRLGAGLQTVNYGMRLEYKLASYLTVYADLCGFNALNGSARRQISARRDAGASVSSDLLYATVGFAAHF